MECDRTGNLATPILRPTRRDEKSSARTSQPGGANVCSRAKATRSFHGLASSATPCHVCDPAVVPIRSTDAAPEGRLPPHSESARL